MKYIKLFENFQSYDSKGIKRNVHIPEKVDIMSLDSLQFYKLIDLLEADIEMYGADDIQYYEEMTGLDVGTLLDLYAGYGFKAHQYTETKKLKDAYVKNVGKPWEQIKDEAEEAEL